MSNLYQSIGWGRNVDRNRSSLQEMAYGGWDDGVGFRFYEKVGF